MAKPLTKAQKAKALRDQPAIPAKKTQTLVITAEQFMAGINKLTDGFDSLARLEKIVLAGQNGRDESEAYSPHGAGYAVPRIVEVPSAQGNKASGQSAPVSVLIDDVHSRTSGLRSKLESLRDALVHGIHPDAPRDKGPGVQGAQPSQGPQKDALNWAFSNLAASDELVEEIARYLLNN